MSAKSKLLDPVAGVLGAAAGVGSFFLIPGLVAALPAAVGIGALVYGAKVAASSFGGGAPREARPAVGAGADAAAPPRVKRGSAADTWHGRGIKALEGMNQVVASCDQPVIKGQLENVAIEAGDSRPVLDQLAGQVAAVQRSLDASPANLRDQRERLTAQLAGDPASQESEQSLDSVRRQEATVDRLLQTRGGLLSRMESIVLGLERLLAEMNETVVASVTSIGPGQGDESHLRDLGDQLSGLRSGLEESRRYTAEILGPDA